MKKRYVNFLCAILCCTATVAEIHYVDLNSSSPVSPYTNWVTAATNIQEAIDVAEPGDIVVVTNGTYYLSEQISITNAITVQSLNGPASTYVDGQNTTRCFNLGNSGCTLSGFTVSHGYATGSYPDFLGGGIYCLGNSPVITNCIISSNYAYSQGGGVSGGTLYDCIITWNTALTGGGGTYVGSLYRCTISDNSSSLGSGGGSRDSTLRSCFLHNNSAWFGGGCNGSILRNCLVTDNSAVEGGGTRAGTLYGCTVAGNSADNGGGCYSDAAYNCIIWGNVGTNSYDNYYAGGHTLAYCCTTPYPGGTGNITDDPLFVGVAVQNYHLQATSPCRDSGNNSYVTELSDLDGNPRIANATVDMGAYEYMVYGQPAVDITMTNTTVDAAVTAIDIIGTNNNYTVGSLDWTNAANGASGTVPVSGKSFTVSAVPLEIGDNLITVTGENVVGDPDSDSVTITRLPPSIHYVSTTGSSVSPYLSWATAATNIQDAVDVALNGKTVLIDDGTYMPSAEIVVSRNITIRSVNGPGHTFVMPSGQHRVFNLGDSACTLSGLTIQNGIAGGDGSGNGGGILCTDHSPYITNCVIAFNLGQYGGGCRYGTLSNCVLSNNNAQAGGGADHSILRACAVIANATSRNGAGCWNSSLYDCDVMENDSEDSGGGCAASTAVNCRLWYNTAHTGGGGFDVVLTNCSVYGNSASVHGGGCASSTLENCEVIDNFAESTGGGCYGSTLTSCMLSRNESHHFDGGGAYGSTIEDCIITNNTAGRWGGGTYQGSMTRCLIMDNIAYEYGGGCYAGAADNCLISGNHAVDEGGGCFAGTFNNCTIAGNSAGDKGGGCRSGEFNNCIIWGNTATNSYDNWYDPSAGMVQRYCCTTPDPGGPGIITQDPLFISIAAGNYRLQGSSPCIDSGTNALAVGSLDLDGKARIVNATVDMGAYEWFGAIVDSDGDGMPDWWELLHFGNATGAVATGHADIDSFDNLSEYIAGSNPTNGASYFMITNIHRDVSGCVIEWTPTISNRDYLVLWSSELTNGFTSIVSAIEFPQQSYTDSVHEAEDNNYYRMEVQLK